jgi:hypothetical protein
VRNTFFWNKLRPWVRMLSCINIHFKIRNKSWKVFVFFFLSFYRLGLMAVPIQKYFWNYESVWTLVGGSSWHKAFTYAEQHNTKRCRQTSMPWVWFEPIIPLFEQPRPHTLNHCFSNCGLQWFARWSTAIHRQFWKKKCCKSCIRHWTNGKYTHTCLC